MTMSEGASSKAKNAMKRGSSAANSQCGTAREAVALPLPQSADESEIGPVTRYADSWQSLMAALVKLKSLSASSCASSPTATPDAAPSEVGSGCSSPCRFWADEEDEEELVEEDDAEPGCSQASKSSRRRNRRRGTRRRARRGSGSSVASSHCDMHEEAPNLSLVQSGVKDEVSSEGRCMDSWHSIMAALIKKKLPAPSSSTTATATPDFALSEVGSGCSTPRPCMAEEEPPEDQDSQSECSPLSKSARRRNRRGTRRRRTRRGRGAASSGAMAGLVDKEGCGPIDEQVATGNANRDVVLLSDLFLGLDSPCANGSNAVCAQADFPTRVGPMGASSSMIAPASNARPQSPGSSPLLLESPEVAWVPPGPDATPPGVVSPDTCTGRVAFVGQPCTWMRVGVGGQASDMQALVPRAIDFTSAVNVTSPCSHGPLLSSPCQAQTAPTGGIMSTSMAYVSSPCSRGPLLSSPCQAQTAPTGGIMNTPTANVASPCSQGLFLSSPCHAQTAPTGGIMSISTANVGAQCSHGPLLSSPCHARTAPTGGIMSTSPTTAPGPCSPAGGITGAGSQSADVLRSWLHASGLPSAADLIVQLQAAAPEVYED